LLIAELKMVNGTMTVSW